MLVSAYVPCFNNRETLGAAIHSLTLQSRALDEIIVVDDGSTDGSAEIARVRGIRVITHPRNLGRGAARARAMQEASHDLVACCDATNELETNFVAHALHWFEERSVAAVFGRISQMPAQNVIERWRGRHLYRENEPQLLIHGALLATFGAIMRRSAVLAVGNFNPCRRHNEDAELGQRLLSAGYDVIYDPDLIMISRRSDDLPSVMERYWRWNAGINGSVSWKNYLKQIIYAFKVMARQDLKARDPLSVPISLLSAHYQFWRSRREAQRASDPKIQSQS